MTLPIRLSAALLMFIRDNLKGATDIAIERLMNLKLVEEVRKEFEAKRGR